MKLLRFGKKKRAVDSDKESTQSKSVDESAVAAVATPAETPDTTAQPAPAAEAGPDAALDALAEASREAPTDQPGETPAGQPGEASADQPGEAPTDEPGEAPADQPGETPENAATEAEAEEPKASPAVAAGSQDDLLAQIGNEADAELEAEEKAATAEGGSDSGDDSLDSDLLDIFTDARNEVQEISLAAELDDVSAQDLLSEVIGISDRLGAAVRAATGGDSPASANVNTTGGDDEAAATSGDTADPDAVQQSPEVSPADPGKRSGP